VKKKAQKKKSEWRRLGGPWKGSLGWVYGLKGPAVSAVDEWPCRAGPSGQGRNNGRGLVDLHAVLGTLLAGSLVHPPPNRTVRELEKCRTGDSGITV
jgi:hypothetical protein